MKAAKFFQVFLCLVALMLIPAIAWAQLSGDEAVAQTLFDQGKVALAEKNYALACPAFEKSQRLSPAGGTLLFLAICREGEGKTATAWVLFNDVLSKAREAKRVDRETVAREHLDALTPRLEKVSIEVSAPMADEVVFVDDVAIGRAVWGTRYPIDPGSHTLVARAALKVAYRTSFEVPTNASLVIPALLRDLKAEAEAAAAAEAKRGRELARENESRPSSTQAVLSLTSLGLGVVGLGVGTGFGLASSSKHGEAIAACQLGPNRDQCDAKGLAANVDAQRAGNVSTVAFIAGGVFVATGAILWFTQPRAQSRVGLGAGLTSVTVQGEF
jgi:hypothetical protein